MEKTANVALLLDAAYEYLKSERPNESVSEIYKGYNFVSFDELYDEVISLKGLEANASEKTALLTALKEDSRFVFSANGEWDIKRSKRSMVDEAYNYLKELQAEAKRTNPNGPIDIAIDFQSLYDEVIRRLGVKQTEAITKTGVFYTNLTLDGRFVILANYKWDLRENQKSDVNKDIKQFYLEDDAETRGNLDPDDFDDEEKSEIGIEGEDDDSSNSEDREENY